MKVLIFDGFWTIDDTKKYSNYIFIYGDNDIHKGKGGQAIIRDQKNAMGIPTKKLPNNNYNSFYNDDEYEQNKLKIKKAVIDILVKLKTNKQYIGIILPKDGLGTGLSKLPSKAPRTYKYLLNIINKLKTCVESI